MAKYRKKPVVIEAVEFTSPRDVLAWLSKLGIDSGRYRVNHLVIEIDTLEGTMTASPGDWIIQGVMGELYPCKADIFAATYEPA